MESSGMLLAVLCASLALALCQGQSSREVSDEEYTVKKSPSSSEKELVEAMEELLGKFQSRFPSYEKKAGTIPLENAPIVMDNGSGYSKSGFASVDKPTSIHRTIVGIPMAQIHMKAAGSGYCMGNDVFQVQNLTKKKPIRHGIVVDWDAMERLWHHIFYHELRVAPDDHPIMLTDAPFSPTTNREKATVFITMLAKL
ncbi:UNVERIFIED_CONTAM: hypothetical protein FKN15_041458 [Acipenser sinensis]